MSKIVVVGANHAGTAAINTILDNYEGNVVQLDPEISKFTEFKSRLDCLATQLVDIDAALAKKSVKGIFATAYIVGENVASAFRKLKAIVCKRIVPF